ncbi:MAG TPA: ParA family protein [Actinomycetota bacterium]
MEPPAEPPGPEREGEPAERPTEPASPIGPSAASPNPQVRVEGSLEQPPAEAGGRIIAVANQKGGVGKSTTAVNLGAALAESGARVLVVDMDPQGNASTGLGISPQDREITTYQVLAAGLPAARAIMATAVEGLSAITSTIDLAGAEIELVSQFSREMRLARALDGVVEGYDYVIVDCPPSLGLLTVNSLAAADELIVPIQCEYYALEGLGQLLRNVRLVQQNLNPRLRLTGIVLTMYDSRTKLAEQVVAEVRKYFGRRVYDTLIPRSVRLSEAPGYGQPITTYDPGSKGAEAYRALASEVAQGPREVETPMPTEDMPEVVLPEPSPEDLDGEDEQEPEPAVKRRRGLFRRKGDES